MQGNSNKSLSQMQDEVILTFNISYPGLEDDLDVNTDVYSKVTVTIIYTIIFGLGVFGNFVTLQIFFQKKSIKHLQGTVHYHLASLAVSDLFILVICMPIELYNFIWIHHPWAFGEVACRSYYFLRDGCSYATSLNIASLSMERYMAICHPFRAKIIMSRGRTRRIICALWFASLLLASPMLFTMGQRNVGKEQICTTIVSTGAAKVVLQVNALLSFAVPMLVISVMNGLIGQELQHISQKALVPYYRCPTASSFTMKNGRMCSLRHGFNVLRAVVIAFVVCWLPYHARRLMYCYVTEWTSCLYDFYHYFYMVTNVLFYVSSAINPILYNLVSSNYRQIFFSTLNYFCLMCKNGQCNLNIKTQHLPQQVPTILVTSPTTDQTFCTTDMMETMY